MLLIPNLLPLFFFFFLNAVSFGRLTTDMYQMYDLNLNLVLGIIGIVLAKHTQSSGFIS